MSHVLPAKSAGSPKARTVTRWSILGAKVLAALLSITIVVASYWVWSTWSNFQSSIPVGDPISQFTPTSSASTTPTAAPKNSPEQNILLLGNDSRAGATPKELLDLGTADDGGSANTDTMMILHIPADGKDASIISFPRDAYVAIPGYGMAKLNAAYPDGYYAAKNGGASEIKSESAGVQVVANALRQLTGLQIDRYIQINLLGFYRISNAIGGVPVLLCQAQNAQTDSDAYGSGYSGINLPAGLSKISGKQALAFVRQRHGLPGGDLDRIKRQQYFLRQVFHQLLTAGTLVNPIEIQNLLSAVSKSLLIGGPINILQLASTFADMSDGGIVTQTIPTDGDNPNSPVGDVVLVSPAEVQARVAQIVGAGADPKLAAAPTVAAASVSVVVINASTTNDVATRNAQALVTAGFRASVDTHTSGTVATTEIEYPDGMQSAAKTLAAQIPGAQLIKTSLVSRVTLRLGTDGQLVKGAGGSGASSGTSSSTTIATGKARVANQRGCIN